MADSILIVEDDQDIAELIKVNMQDLGLEVTHCDNGEDAIKQALENDYSLIMLDLNLPGCSGLDVCRKVREAKQEQAILMLTARTSEIDRVLGLELGADDYMAKPFSVRELQARVHALLRRVHLLQNNQTQEPMADNGVICHGQLMINQRTHEVVLREQSLDLTSTEFDLLSFMALNPGQVFSRTQLLDKVWGYQHSGYEHTVNSHINRLRNKLVAGQPNSNNKVFPHIIQTVFGVGYKFSPEGVV
ncbi:response regulator transcription factor [Psychromonas arctica]|uniref:response regulator transcription factor n=1 Tax=Psychromonas arctica TaxID=168275 RepID=UPI002FD1C248